VILDVYGGPKHLHVVQAMRNWLVPQWLADQGFVVVAVDNRGTPGRGRDWEASIYQKFGTVPLAVALNNDGSLRKLTAVDATPETEKQIGFILGQFEGKGKRGGNYAKAKILFESRDKVAKPYSNTAFRLWMRVLEASFMFERDERDRTLLDDEINKSVSKKKPTAEDEEEEAAEFQMK
jgi:hypothetical protein